MQVRNKFWLKSALLLMLVVLLDACVYTKPQKGNPTMKDINQSLQEAYTANKHVAHKHRANSSLNADLASDLATSGSLFGKTVSNEQRFDIAANDVPAKDFFMGLVKDTSYNMIVSPKIQGVVTLNLKQVTISEVLQAAKATCNVSC